MLAKKILVKDPNYFLVKNQKLVKIEILAKGPNFS